MKNKNILFIEGTKGFVNQAIVNNLEASGLVVTRIEDDLDSIVYHRFDSELILYYPAHNNDHILLIMQYLTELCHNEHKTLCLIGEDHFIRAAEEVDDREHIAAVFKRPIDIHKLTKKILSLLDRHEEFNRMKTVLVVDDDNDFLTIMNKWLSGTYKVDTLRTGVEALFYLERIRPDLILLDYEMPELDGYQVMDAVRKRPLTSHVPIIFLTGKNDRESVMRIISKKPDGYLLKSMKKEELLDTLTRFFDESILVKNDKLSA